MVRAKGKWAMSWALFFVFFLSVTDSPALAKPVVLFGLCPKYNPRIMYQLYQPFMDYLNESSPYQFEIKLSRHYGETVERLGNGEIDIASCGPVPYVKAREKFGIKPILRALRKGGEAYYRGIMIVREDSPIQKLKDLRGRSFAFGPVWSTAGHVLPEYYLRKADIRLKDLKHYDFLRHHDSVANAVLKGQFEAGAVKDIIAYKYEKAGLRFLFLTEPIPTVPIVTRRDAPEEMIRSVKTALLNLNPQNPNHQKMMAKWDEEFKYGFTEASDADYDVIRRILEAMPVEQNQKGTIRD